jgi:tetratricopeptide (TPR) repeat protein
MNLLEQNQRLIAICSKKIEQNPCNIKALLLRSSIYIKLNDYSRAENDIFKIIKQNPNLSASYFLLGIISQKKKDFQQSLFHFSKAIEIEPNNVNALFYRAAIYNELGFFKKAIDDYYLALEKDSMKSSTKNTYKNIVKLLGAINEDENENNLYNNTKSNLDLDAEINNYVYNQLKTLYMQNQGNQQFNQNQDMQISQSTNIYISNNPKITNTLSNKDKENEVKEIYDPNPNDANYNENAFLIYDTFYDTLKMR